MTDEHFLVFAAGLGDGQQSTCEDGACELQRLTVLNRHVSQMYRFAVHLTRTTTTADICVSRSKKVESR